MRGVRGTYGGFAVKRRFENTRGDHNKFWEVEVNGASMIRRWGRIGTTGQTKTFPFHSKRAALMKASELIQAKLDKGYVEVGLTDKVPPFNHAVETAEPKDEFLARLQAKIKAKWGTDAG